MTQPPIIPGRTPEAFTLSSVLPAGNPPRAPKWVVPVIAVLVLLVVAGGGVAAWAIANQSADAATPAVSATSDPPAPQQTTAPPAARTYPTPAPPDFTIAVNVTSKKCFGSAGCNLEYKIDVTYNGAATEPNKVWYVTYEVTGGDDPQINTFEFRSTSATKYTVSVQDKERISTPSSDSVLTASVTRVAER